MPSTRGFVSTCLILAISSVALWAQDASPKPLPTETKITESPVRCEALLAARPLAGNGNARACLAFGRCRRQMDR